MPGIIASHDGHTDGPVAKRQRVGDYGATKQSRTSRVFAPFRTVGLVSPTAVPFTTVPLGKTTFQVTTSVGRSLQTYDLRRGLNLVFITRPQTPSVITATLAWKDRVLAAWGEDRDSGRGIWVFKRGKKIAELELPKDTNEPIRELLVFGSWIVACGHTRIEVWKSATYEHYTSLISPHGSSLSGGMCNMPTYLNKVFVGRENGTVEIWNVSTGVLVHTINPASSEYGPITALEPAPAVSLLAIAYESGPVEIRDVRSDVDLLTVNTGVSSSQPVSSISFRTDGMGAGEDGRKSGVMATASRSGSDVTFWDLNGGGRRMGVLRGAHNSSIDSGYGGIGKIEFLVGQPVLITSGLDNSLRSWISDETPFSPIPRILHSRSGHAAPLTTLQFLPTDADGADAGGKWLLSASNDRSLWGWSLRRDGQSTELSQGNIRHKAKKAGLLGDNTTSAEGSSIEDLKAPPITCLACSLNRDGGMGAMPGKTQLWQRMSKGKGASDAEKSSMTGWESVITGHKGDKTARTWFWGRKRAGRWAFETGDGSEVRSVTLSPCGTFGLIGSAAGGIDMFNMQSGMHRQRFPPRLTPAQARRLKLQQQRDASTDGAEKKYLRGTGKHTAAVTGLVVDNMNKTMISCGEDGRIKFWDFATGSLVHEIDWSHTASVTGSRYHRPSDLLAVSCSDGAVRVIDIETKKLVRELLGSGGPLRDFCFSNDGRWIITASDDAAVRTFDLPTGHLIDAMRLPAPCNALAFSNTGEYLATAQEDAVGVDIWTNRTLFTHVPTRQISEKEIAEAAVPSASGEGGQGIISAAFAEADLEDDEINVATAPVMEQLSEGIMTLSLVPKSRWQNLLNLDLIRERNKPKEPPKAPEKAPFFLPSLQNGTSEPDRTVVDPNPANLEAERSRVMRMDREQVRALTKLLHAAAETQDYEKLLDHLKSLSAAAADIEIRSLNPLPPYLEPITFVRALTARLRTRRDYELVQAWMAVFLRLHGDVLTADDSLLTAIKEWRTEQEKETTRLSELVGYCSGVVGFLRSARG